MAQRLEIKYVNKTNRLWAHDRIQSICGINADGALWTVSAVNAIHYIEHGIYRFYVRRGGRTEDVVIATSNGMKYLKTKYDNHQPTVLLSLPSCP